MTIQDITCFLKLAETLNYTKTAEELFISQPAVTRHINSLEDELGVKLFDRSVKRNITLTEAGKIYFDGLKKCKGIYEETLSTINLKANENPLIMNFLRGIRIPDEIVDATAEYMSAHPNFHHFTNFIEPSMLEAALESGEIVICQEEFAAKLKGYKSMTLTNTPVPHYLVASNKHSGFKDDALDRCNKHFNEALGLWRKGYRDKAMFELGMSLHYLQDMCCYMHLWGYAQNYFPLKLITHLTMEPFEPRNNFNLVNDF